MFLFLWSIKVPNWCRIVSYAYWLMLHQLIKKYSFHYYIFVLLENNLCYLLTSFKYA